MDWDLHQTKLPFKLRKLSPGFVLPALTLSLSLFFLVGFFLNKDASSETLPYLFLGLILAGFSYFLFQKNQKEIEMHRQLLRKGIATPAKIMGYDPKRSNKVRPSFIVQYSWKGETFEEVYKSPGHRWLHHPKLGDTVTLYIDPSNPKHFIILETSAFKPT